MEEHIKKAFNNATYEPQSNLPDTVWQTLLIRGERQTKIRFWFFSVGSLFSFAGVVYAFSNLKAELATSGFNEYFSLIFSDGRSISSYWKDFSVTLLTAVPLMAVIISLSFVFIFIVMVRYALRQGTRNQLVVSF